MTDTSQQEQPLDDEAMRGSDLLENLMTAAKESARATANAPNTTPTGRPRGRPPGSRNRTAIEREAAASTTPTRQVARQPSSRVVPPNVPPPPPQNDKLQGEELRQFKLERARALGQSISDTINDNFMLLLTSMGVPAQFIYKEGHAPRPAIENEKYTDFARDLTISPNQAATWGRFVAELEQTEQGQKFSKATGGGNGPLIVYGVLSLATAIQYAQGLSSAYKKLGPMLEQYKAWQQEMAARQAEAAARAQNGQQQQAPQGYIPVDEPIGG